MSDGRVPFDLSALIDGIGVRPTSGSQGQFRVRRIPGGEGQYAGVGSVGQPSLLFRVDRTAVRPPVRLAGIEVWFGIPCRIALDDAEEIEQTLTVLTCPTEDLQSRRYFLHVCAMLLRLLGSAPSEQEIEDGVIRLVGLFSRLSQPAANTVIGLVGELYAIDLSARPSHVISSWRSSTDSRFDFAQGTIRVEVKASSDRTRAHSFSYEQCHPPPGTKGIAISMFVESAGGGLSVLDLLNRIEHRLADDPKSTLRLHEVVATTLGESLVSALQHRFDDHVATSSVHFYELSSIPGIRGDLPNGVSQVRFRSDLSRCQHLSPEAVINLDPAFEDFLPR